MALTMLIVDDEVEICAMLSRYFALKGFTTRSAHHGIEALAVLAEQHVDIVISDIMMPQMDGVSLLRAIRSEYPMVRVVMITGYVTLDNALACMRLQADTCVFKPFSNFDVLSAAVDDAVAALERWNTIFRQLRGMKPAARAPRP